MAEIVIRGVQPAEEFALEAAGVRTRQDDRAGGWFDALFQTHYPRIVGMLGRLTGDRGQAEEIAADAFCKLVRHQANAESDGLAAWVYRVAMNAGVDAVRSNARRRRREKVAGAENLRAAAPGALEGLLREERCARVRDVLAALKPREAQLLLLRAQGMSYREVALALGIQVGSVGTLLARAEAEFERRFRARHGDDV